MTTSVDLLRSFAASVCLTLGLARLAEKFDPSALAASAGWPGHTASAQCVTPCRVPGEALLRTCLLSSPCQVPVRAAVACITCSVPAGPALRSCLLSMPCEAPVRATVQPSMPCISCGTACNVPMRHAAV